MFYRFYSAFNGNPVNVDPYQMPHYVTSNLGLRYLPMTLFRVLLHK